ncbi:putative 1,4-beta-D-glucan-cellobiohydrolyase [Aspergillus aculeatinus CBS 121060]|uniref:1,4-beta-D-glucan cellobiohydrolase B n=1 Tax=Aspergillus aculeatinus CBS 121060 TaxID=1448322 RepID=A0ACD1H2I3_9EURO|nr:1,4-beta-D-glucan cellobiohydrolase B [Aspergillus aculeatinus CBS 121060]RAH67783.1 1,4-beta-D-glucan cellobiohydrolase B [Aspergillus aculeatinus CBS 121060]
MVDSFSIYKTALLLSMLATSNAQQVGTYTTETHPSLTWQTCSGSGSCTTTSGSVVIDANWRWVHEVGGYTNCYSGNTWDSSICSTDTTCASECALEGATYASTYGVTTSGSSLRLNFVTTSSQKNIGSRLYLLADDSTYETFKLLNREFTFDVDVSNLPCGLNGALYFVSMDADGGVSRFPTNKAGAKYGTGYCDSQCPRDLKFIDGQANIEGWEPSSTDVNAGSGNHGSCCPEMDIWEANSVSSAFTAHPCDSVQQTMCTGDSCGGTYSDTADRYSGTCDPDGCDFNPYRLGNTNFYGPGKTVDTSKPFTVVTQFITNDGTDTGTLTEIRRLYVQNGVVIGNGPSTYTAASGNSITESFCKAEKTLFGDTNVFDTHGGLSAMGDALGDGMVLVLSLWDDHAADMLWLDSDYPTTSSATSPGVARGTCPTTTGNATYVEANYPNSYVTYSNIKFGTLNSTYSGSTSGGSSSSSTTLTTKASTTTTSSKTTTTSSKTTTTSSKTTTTTSKTSTTSSSSTNVAQLYGQCGGQGWTGPTTCASGTCTKQNDFYSQCL